MSRVAGLHLTPEDEDAAHEAPLDGRVHLVGRRLHLEPRRAAQLVDGYARQHEPHRPARQERQTRQAR
jgi:hypothetical protein